MAYQRKYPLIEFTPKTFNPVKKDDGLWDKYVVETEFGNLMVWFEHMPEGEIPAWILDGKIGEQVELRREQLRKRNG